MIATACGDSSDPKINYNLGNVGSFAEMVNAGVKDLALSSPMSPAEMDEFMPLAKDVASRHNVEVYRESDLLVTQLFPADVAEGKEVLLLYQGSTLDTYKKIKEDKALTGGDFDKELDISRRFGRLLSYTPRKINRLLAENTDYRVMSDFGINATNVFLYYKDLPKATHFYKDVLGLELLTEYDNASVFLITKGAYLICVDAAKGMHSADEPKSVHWHCSPISYLSGMPMCKRRMCLSSTPISRVKVVRMMALWLSIRKAIYWSLSSSNRIRKMSFRDYSGQ